MVLYLIGLGLGDESDITLKGLNAIRSCSHVFLEEYTAIMTGISKERLQSAYGCVDILSADREMVESSAERILEHAKDANVAFLVVGDPFAATTHHDLFLRAASCGVEVCVVHNASIVNAVGATGLQLYAFGQIVSIPFFRDGWRPDSFYDKIQLNARAHLHTMCLLDIKVKEQSVENLAKGIKTYEPPRFMSVKQCIEQLLEVEDRRQGGAYSRTSPAFGVARLGQSTQKIVSGTLEELLHVDFGPPLHTLVLAGELHFVECDMFEFYHWNRAQRAEQRSQEQADEAERQRAQWDAEGKERRERDEQRKRDLLLRKQLDRNLNTRDLEDRKRPPSHEPATNSDEEETVELEPLC